MTPFHFPVRKLLPVLVALGVTATSAFAGTLTGTIRAADTHQPLASKVVVAYDTTGTLRGSATSDPTGGYVLMLPAGSYRVLAYDAEGMYATMFDGNAESFETTPLTVIGANDTVRRDFSLVLGGSITGSVTAPSGMGQSGVIVEAYNLSGTRRGFTSTDAQGAYSIVLPPGEYKLVAYDPAGAYAFSFYRTAHTFADAERVAVTAGQSTGGVNLRLEVAGRIVGTAIDAATSLPLRGIEVYAYTPAGALVGRSVTDAAGAFRFSVPPGQYRLVAADPARTYAPGYYGGVNAFEKSTVVTLSGGQQTNVQIALTRGATIAGRVRDSSGAAIANVTAAAYNLDGTLHASATTNASGAFELLVAPGTYKLVVFDAQLTYATRYFSGAHDFASSGPVGVAAGQKLSGFDFTIARGGRISGTVRENGTPRGGITVGAYDVTGVLTASTVTKSDGTYAFVVPPGDYRLVAFDPELRFAPAYAGGATSFDQTVPRSIAANTSATIDFSLRRGVQVSGDVIDASGHGLSDVTVFALDAAGNRVAGAITVDGAFSLAVPAGTYRFAASHPGYSLMWVDEVISESHAPRLLLILETAARRRATRH